MRTVNRTPEITVAQELPQTLFLKTLTEFIFRKVTYANIANKTSGSMG